MSSKKADLYTRTTERIVAELEKGVRTNQDKIKNELIGLAKEHTQASQIKVFIFMKKFPTDVRHNSKIIREELTLLAEKSLA